MRRRRKWWSYGTGHRSRAEQFVTLGSLYVGLSWDQSEQAMIRHECEQLGLPMGYGRVAATPIQLDSAEAGAQWRADRRER